ncbi:MAG: GSCFA domain-containing protein [Vicingaceae bacterium]
MAFPFRTEFIINKQYPRFGHIHPTFLIGSCFSDNIGSKLNEFLFKVDSNPFGITYNPISASDHLKRLMQKQYFTSDDLIECNGGWNSLELHGSWFDSDSDQLLSRVNNRLEGASVNLKEASHLFVTFGTAWVYEWKNNGLVVNNCLKLPASNFNKRLLGIDEITQVWTKTIDALLEFNPGLSIVFTVSPVRHLRDGFEENYLSKSILRIAIHEIEQEMKVLYFPAFELLSDDLRDYRFYNTDLVHPSETAIEYIWDKFSSCMITESSLQLFKDITGINQAINHRAFDKDSEQYKSFIEKNIRLAQKLKDEHAVPLAKNAMQNLRKKLR